MYNAIFVGIGGFIGAVSRYLLGSYVHTLTKHLPFYFSTLTVNVFGCFLIGIISQIFEKQIDINPEIRLFLMAGILGAFTTYSTFSNDTLNLFREQRVLLSVLNIFSHIFLGLAGVYFGRIMIKAIIK
ncbi:MAG: fluoride efflux transporter CrcB [Candidatus Aminicenantes bacterium]|nr:fluoride efflux transporter CrcB [Candidatus Aminicenantes bacterium]